MAQTLDLAANDAIRARFDHDHGGTPNLVDAYAIAGWVTTRDHREVAVVEASGDLYRVWLASIDAYFWPTHDDHHAWIAALPIG